MSEEIDVKTLIMRMEKKSLECMEGNEILVLKLCELSNDICPIYDKIFGNNFLSKMLKKDLKNSSFRVQKAIEKIPEEIKYVSKMYSYHLNKYDSLEKLKKDNDNGIINFLWMKRALEFIVVFLEKCYISKSSSKLSECAQETYDEVLKSYHSYLTYNLVKLCFKLCPSRENLTKNLGFKSDDEAKTSIKKFCSTSKPLINKISATIEKYGCNFKDKS